MSGKHKHGSKQCREVFARLSEYLDQELDPDVCRSIEEHNRDCSPCQAFLASLRKTVELIGDQPSAVLSDEARRAILADYSALRKASLDQDDRPGPD